ncbi:MAG: divalent-cation tolerance protein CutA [Wenzhouxiangella sp.]
MSEQVCVVLTTCPDEGTAERLAAVLVEQRLAACVSAGSPARSIYPWQGRIEKEEEVPLTIKTTAGCLEQLKRVLVENHPYDVPEVLALPVIDGLDDYTQWIRDWINDDNA